MIRSIFDKRLAVLLIGSFFAGHVWAEKPGWGEHHQSRHDKHRHRDDDNDDQGRFRIEQEGRYGYPVANPYLPPAPGGYYFNDQHRFQIREYYVEQERRGHCPPGLAKKRNGCMPPGQAKKWVIGQRIPKGVIYHDLPPDLYYRMGQPPAGYRYVQAASDILMIAINSGIVNDIIYNLGR